MSEATGAVNSPESHSQLHEQIKLCRRPFTAAAIKWKIQTNPKDNDQRQRAAVVAFIDARLAGERLNAAGIPWSSKYTAVPGGLLCTISVRHPRTGEVILERSDVGWSRGTGDNMTLKTVYSDALKRAAVHFGVGVSIYALPIKYLSGADGEIRQSGRNWYIQPKGQRALDEHYNAWLAEHGVPTFGDVIDHGDMDGAQGDVESEDRANDETVSTSSAASGNAAKPEPSQPAEPAPAAEPEKMVTDTQVSKILDAFAQSNKGVADVQTYLASKGVEGFNPEGTLEQLTELIVSYEVAKGLFVWLKKNAAGA